MAQSLIEDYLAITKTYQQKYGKNTVVLMQVGAFFEVYGLKNEKTGEIEGSNIEEFCQICQLNMSEKKNCVGEGKHVIMAGFRDYTLDKYIQKLTENDTTVYNVVVYVQEKDGKNIKRVLHSIHSAGTYISYENDLCERTTNNMMCIWLETFRPLCNTRNNLVYGISVIDMYTGKSSIFEHHMPFLLNPTTFDELERYISVYSPSEVIFMSSFDDDTVQKIIHYSGLSGKYIHKINEKNERFQKCTKQTYVRHMISKIYGEEAFDICQEFQVYERAIQSFCFLLDFIQEHNPDLIKNLSLPTFNNVSDRMILANHTLQQLNIIGPSGNGQHSSVVSLLNKCCTSMGKRAFHNQITNPTSNVAWLGQEYDMISKLMDCPEMIDMLRKQLKQIRDVEKICRQLVIRKIYPSSVFSLFQAVDTIQQINMCFFDMPELSRYFCANGNAYVEKQTTSIIAFLRRWLRIEMCQSVNSMNTFEQNIFCEGISQELDKCLDDQRKYTAAFHEIKRYLNEILLENDFIKIHETEKSGVSLQITKKRAQILKKNIQDILGKSPDTSLSLGNGMVLRLSDVKFATASSTCDEIDCDTLHKITKGLFEISETLNEIMASVYQEFLGELEKKWYVVLEELAQYISKVDVLQNKVFVAKTYNYCRPELDDASTKSFVDARELRHCLIEHLQKNEIYVTNDIEIGKGAESSEKNGILLYGTNAVGKTSFIRALGIAVILAQSGMYVPCSKFVYKPYTAIYSRILGNDNIFKGLSTFAVEMSELRIILKMADENSMVLGDELCSGTETESALSIFVSGLMNLHEKGSTFLFATHFHEIVKYEEIQNLTFLCCKHMSVYYDREKDCLVYDRKLKDGPGNSMYGLEVCKSLYLPEDFLQNAYSIRCKYFPESRGELANSLSPYNARKIKGKCEMCKENMGEEIHHINHQAEANENGFIGSFHKNHVANLVSVCKKCHDEFHSKPAAPKISRKKTTRGYSIR